MDRQNRLESEHTTSGVRQAGKNGVEPDMGTDIQCAPGASRELEENGRRLGLVACPAPPVEVVRDHVVAR